MNECKHKQLKYFEQTNKVVCLDCGMSWQENYEPILPTIPYVPPTFPSQPGTGDPNPIIYPTITWCKVDDSTPNNK